MSTTEEADLDAGRERARVTTGARAAASAGLDVLLTDAAVGQGTRRFVQPRAVAGVGAGVARHPRRVARRVSGLGGELVRVAAGRARKAPSTGDRRFADPAWQTNWLLRRVLQGYLRRRRERRRRDHGCGRGLADRAPS